MSRSLQPNSETADTAETPAQHGLSPRLWSRATTSVQFKATMLFVLLTLAVTGGVTGYLLSYSARLVRDEAEVHLVQVASLLADAVAPALERADVEQLQTLAASATKRLPQATVLITDINGSVLAREGQAVDEIPQVIQVSNVSADLPPGVRLIEQGNGTLRLLEVKYPVRRRAAGDGPSLDGTPLLGYVQVAAPTNYWERSMASRLDLLIGVGVILVAAIVLLGFLLVRRFTAPIESLANSMTRFAAGELTVRSAIDRVDEIGRLAKAFNLMAAQHQQTHEGMARFNAELEERVASRTQQLREIASREPLTGLYNRRHFNEVLQRRFAEAVRYESELSCIMIDLDGFKIANDAYGHQVGDDMLVLTASTILSQLRTADLAARYGGDEFIILLPQTDARRAEVLADRIMQKFNREMDKRYPRATVSMSMGIGSLRELQPMETEELVRAADNAMYRAKAEGKNRIVGPLHAAPTRAT